MCLSKGMATTRAIPLRARNGTVRAYTVVDSQDFGVIGGFRWRLHPAGYAMRHEAMVNGGARRAILMHRELLGLEHGDPRQADHVNHDPLDNRRSNLRVATVAENGQNRRGGYGRSRHRGVSFLKGRWVAAVVLDGKAHYLGLYDDEDEAGRVAARFRAEHMHFSAEAAAA